MMKMKNLLITLDIILFLLLFNELIMTREFTWGSIIIAFCLGFLVRELTSK